MADRPARGAIGIARASILPAAAMLRLARAERVRARRQPWRGASPLFGARHLDTPGTGSHL